MTATSASMPTVHLGGAVINALRESEVAEHVVDALAHHRGGLLVTPNLDHLQRLETGPGPFTDAYDLASLVVPDGQPLLWAARLQGTPLPERVAGSSLLWTLSEAAADCDLAVMLVGGGPLAAERTAERLTSVYPRLQVVETTCPTISSPPTPGEISEIVEAVVASRASIVFLALGTPKQEILAMSLRNRLPNVWFVGVGAAFDMAAGHRRRAPRVLQRIGLEWAFRLAQEPRRLARRYLANNMPFLFRLLRNSITIRIRGARATPS